VNGKKYVGQTTKTFEERLKNHIKNSRRHDHPIYRAIRKYNISNFDSYYYDCDESVLDYLETELIKVFDTVKTGYNCEYGGNKNKVISDETRKKNSEAQIGHIPWNKGKVGSQKAWNKDIKTGPTGKPPYTKETMNEETRKKHFKNNKGENNPMFGCKWTLVNGRRVYVWLERQSISS